MNLINIYAVADAFAKQPGSIIIKYYSYFAKLTNYTEIMQIFPL